jgi:hypothetical protein
MKMKDDDLLITHDDERAIGGNSTTALALIENMTPAKLFAPGAIDPILERIKNEARAREAKEKAGREEKERAEAYAQILVKQAEEKAERGRIAAELKSKQDQEAAIQRERERVERENKAAADALAAREADKQHKGRINREILKAFIGAGFDEATGKSIIELIAKGKVPHVGIQY